MEEQFENITPHIQRDSQQSVKVEDINGQENEERVDTDHNLVDEGKELNPRESFRPWNALATSTMRAQSKAHHIKMVSMILVFQIVIVQYLVRDLSKDFVAKTVKVLDAEVGIAKLMCGILLHYAMTDNIRLGMNMMKFVLNHPWKFEN